MSTPRIAIIVGTTREGRFSERLADFVMSQVSARDDLEFDLVDLRDHPLPMFDEPGPPAMFPSQRDEVAAWRDTVAAYDGYIIVTGEYNNSIPAVLKNALDHVYAEWGTQAGGVRRLRLRRWGAGGSAPASGGHRAADGAHPRQRAHPRRRLHARHEGREAARRPALPARIGERDGRPAGLVGHRSAPGPRG